VGQPITHKRSTTQTTTLCQVVRYMWIQCVPDVGRHCVAVWGWAKENQTTPSNLNSQWPYCFLLFVLLQITG